MKLNCYIVDDEYHAIETLREFIRQTPGLNLAGSSENPLVALQEVQLKRPDVIFLDVDMPELSGLDFADLVSMTALVVFTTAYREYAIAAYDRQVFDYLLKPVTYERFIKCIYKVRQDFMQKRPAQNRDRDFFYVKSAISGKLDKVEQADLLYVEAAQNYVQLYLPDRKHMAYLTISEVEAYLPGADFSRIHKSFIVRHAAIRSLEPGQVKLTNGVSLPLGRAYREAFSQKMGQLVLRSRRGA